MSRPATSRLKVNPPLGLMPALQYLLPAQLRVDPAYQRSLELGSSQTLIRKIAQFWNWDLCQPLVVARRENGDLFVIDGQHRLEAARMRGDIAQLPAVVVQYASAADEAASFVHLNQQRRPLTKIDVFKAAVASGDPQSCAIVEALEYAGLSLAPHTNCTAWKPGMVANIGGLETAWRVFGPKIAERAMEALRLAFDGEVLRYAGTIFPGLVAVCSDEMAGKQAFGGERFERFYRAVGRVGQADWRKLIARFRADEPSHTSTLAAAIVFRREWGKELGTAAGAPPALRFEARADGKAWCDQCDMAVTEAEARGCKSRFCSLKAAA